MDKRVSWINVSSETLAPIIWAVTFIGTAISIAFNWFFGSRTLLTQLVMAALLSGSILAILFLARTLSHPFVGDLKISPAPFQALYAPQENENRTGWAPEPAPAGRRAACRGSI